MSHYEQDLRLNDTVTGTSVGFPDQLLQHAAPVRFTLAERSTLDLWIDSCYSNSSTSTPDPSICRVTSADLVQVRSSASSSQTVPPSECELLPSPTSDHQSCAISSCRSRRLLNTSRVQPEESQLPPGSYLFILYFFFNLYCVK